jgi:hypothetical protein
VGYLVEQTTARHQTNIKDILGMHRQGELVKQAMRIGLVSEICRHIGSRPISGASQIRVLPG